MRSRVQSPTSILTYKECPRKYYYRYILCLKQKPSIYLIRGRIAHEVIRRIFESLKKDQSLLDDGQLILRVKAVFLAEWQKARPELRTVGKTRIQLDLAKKETESMLMNWARNLTRNENYGNKITIPTTELQLVSEEYGVQGFLDAVYDEGEAIRILDFKTGKPGDISEEYRLQLAIYALLYEESNGKQPDYVGLQFLQNGDKQWLPVDEKLLALARRECKLIHLNTMSQNIDDYPCLCGGRCREDFYEA